MMTIAIRTVQQKAAVVAVITALTTTACAVTFISRYDEQTDKGATAIVAELDKMMMALDRDPAPPYEDVKTSYTAIHRELSALRFRNEVRPKNDLTVRQIAELQASIKIFEDQHKAGKLVQPMLSPARASLEQSLRAILKLELKKKELDKDE